MSPSDEVSQPCRRSQGPEVRPVTLADTLPAPSRTIGGTFGGINPLGTAFGQCDRGPQVCRAVFAWVSSWFLSRWPSEVTWDPGIHPSHRTGPRRRSRALVRAARGAFGRPALPASRTARDDVAGGSQFDDGVVVLSGGPMPGLWRGRKGGREFPRANARREPMTGET